MPVIQIFDGKITVCSLNGELLANVNQLHAFLEQTKDLQVALLNVSPTNKRQIDGDYYLNESGITEYFATVHVINAVKNEFYKKFQTAYPSKKTPTIDPLLFHPEFLTCFESDQNAEPFTVRDLKAYYLAFTESETMPVNETTFARLFVSSIKRKDFPFFYSKRKTNKRITYYFGIRFVNKRSSISAINFMGRSVAVRLNKTVPQIDLTGLHAVLTTGQKLDTLLPQIDPSQLVLQNDTYWVSREGLSQYLAGINTLDQFKQTLLKNFDDWIDANSPKLKTWEQFIRAFKPDLNAPSFTVKDLESYYLRFTGLPELPPELPSTIALAQSFVRSVKDVSTFSSRRVGVKKTVVYSGLKFTGEL